MMAAVSMVLAGGAMASSTTHLVSCELGIRGGSYNMNVVVNEVSGPMGSGSSTSAVITETSVEGQTSEIVSYDDVRKVQDGATDGPLVYATEDGSFSLQVEMRAPVGDGFRAQLEARANHGRKISQSGLVCRLVSQN